MLADEAAEFGKIADAVHALPKSGEMRRPCREVAARAGQTPAGNRRPVQLEFILDQMKQYASSFRRRGGRHFDPALDQRPRLPENPWVPQTSSPDCHRVRS